MKRTIVTVSLAVVGLMTAGPASHSNGRNLR